MYFIDKVKHLIKFFKIFESTIISLQIKDTCFTVFGQLQHNTKYQLPTGLWQTLSESLTKKTHKTNEVYLHTKLMGMHFDFNSHHR